MAASNLASIVAAAAKDAKIEMIGNLPTMPVSGDVGLGFFCVPGAINDLHFLTEVPDKARGFILQTVLRGAMQRAQAGLKAFDAKNKDATVEQRRDAAQKAFADALNGSADYQFNESNTLHNEALRLFKSELLPQVAASRPAPLVTDDAFMTDVVLPDLEKNRKDAYDAKVNALKASIAESRTYTPSRKGKTEGVSVNTATLNF